MAGEQFMTLISHAFISYKHLDEVSLLLVLWRNPILGFWTTGEAFRQHVHRFLIDIISRMTLSFQPVGIVTSNDGTCTPNAAPTVNVGFFMTMYYTLMVSLTSGNYFIQ